MFEVGFTEIVMILGIALVVLGPEKLPKVAREVGRWLGRARSMARQLKSQLDEEVLKEDRWAKPRPSRPRPGSSRPRPAAGQASTEARPAAGEAEAKGTDEPPPDEPDLQATTADSAEANSPDVGDDSPAEPVSAAAPADADKPAH